MPRAARYVATGVLAIVARAGCGSSRSASRSPVMPTPTLVGAAAIRGIDPCKLLTRAEIAASLGKSVGSPVRRMTTSNATCTWTVVGADRGGQGVVVQAGPASVFDTTIAAGIGDQSKLPRTARTTVERLPSIGKEAYTVSLADQSRYFGLGGDLVAVRVGDLGVCVSTESSDIGDQGSLIVSSTLATKAIARL